MNPSTDQRRGLRVVPTHGSGTGRVAHLGWVVVLVDGRDPRAMATCLDVLDRQEPSDAARLVDRLRLLLGPTPPTLCAVVPTDGGFEIAARGAVRVVGDRPSGSDELTGAADEWWTGRLDGASFVTASVGDQDAIVDDTLDLRRGIVAADAVVVLAPAMDRPGAEVAAAAPSAAGEPVGADAPADDAGSAEPAPFVAGAAAAVAAGAGPDMARDEGPDEDDQPTTISTYESDRARRLDVPDLPGGADEDDAAVEPSVGDDEPALPAPPPPFRPPGSEPAPFAPPGPGAEPAGATAASGDDDAEAPGPPGSVPSVPGMSVPSALPGPAPSMPVAGGGPRPGPDATGPDDADRMGAAPPSPAADAPPPAPAGLGGAPDLPPAPAPFEPPGHGREDDAPAPPAPAPFAPAESSPSDAEAPAEPPGPAPAPFAPPAPAAEAGAPLPAEPPAPFA
ncbi:MAG: hypothetical protein S0880_00795, partial [Actinomycetota bacterium]|nr:hypothetical protein [Actinomycetota bacterium]